MTDSEIYAILQILSSLGSELSEVNVVVLASELHSERTLTFGELPALLISIHRCMEDFSLQS